MAILQGIEVAIVPVTSKGEPIEEALFDGLPVSSSHRSYQVQHKNLHKQTACFLRVRKSTEKKDVHFAVRLKVINRYEWLQNKQLKELKELKAVKVDSVRVDISIDGGSLSYTSKYKKTQLASNRSKHIDKFLYEEVGQSQLQLSSVQFEKRNSNACDIRFLDEPGDDEGEIIVKVAQGRQGTTKKAGAMTLPKKGVSKKSTDALLAKGITMFAAPNLSRAKSVTGDPGEGISFTRVQKADELVFTFAYRQSHCLMEGAGGRFSSRAPSAQAGKSRSLIVAIPTPLKPPSISASSKYHSSHSKDVFYQSNSYARSTEITGSVHEASMYDVAATKRRWLEEGDDHEEMDEQNFKRQKLEAVEDQAIRLESAHHNKPMLRAKHSQYKADQLEQIDLTVDPDSGDEQKAVLDSKDVKTKAEPADQDLVLRPSPKPVKPMNDYQPAKSMSKDPRSMSEDEIAAELREIRLQQLHAELDRRKTMA